MTDLITYNEFKLLTLTNFSYVLFMSICKKYNFTDIECELLYDEVIEIKG